MFVADELVKILICELCFENYNEKDKLPLSFYPCGHTYCFDCFSNLNNNICPYCKKEIQTTLKNWAILNIIPKPKFPQIYHDLKTDLSNGANLLNRFDKLNKKIDIVWKTLFETIRIEINKKTEDLIFRIKEMELNLLINLNKHQTNWLNLCNENLEFSKELNDICYDINSNLKNDEISINEFKLNEFKCMIEKCLQEIYGKIKFLEKNYMNKKLSFQENEINFNNSKSYNETFVLGEILMVEKVNYISDDDDLSNDKLSFETYSEIESNNMEKIKNLVIKNDDNLKTTFNISCQKENSENLQKNDIGSVSFEIKINDEHSKSKEYFGFKDNLITEIKNSETIGPSNQLIIDKEEYKKSISFPRYCRLKRSSKTQFYGFDLKTTKKDNLHKIISIENGSPAQKSGLLEGDVILEVNGEPIKNEDRDEVVKKIIRNSKNVELLVVNNFENYMDLQEQCFFEYLPNKISNEITNNEINNNSDISIINPTNHSNQALLQDKNSLNPTLSRSITIIHTKENKWLGFSLEKRNNGPHMITFIEKNSPASISGLQLNDLILRINNINLIGKDYLETVEILKKESEKENMELEVIESGLFYLTKNRIISTSFLDLNIKDTNTTYDSYNSDINKNKVTCDQIRENSNRSIQNSMDKVNNKKFNDSKISTFVKRIRKNRKKKHDF